jgi:hypothetical protein
LITGKFPSTFGLYSIRNGPPIFLNLRQSRRLRRRLGIFVGQGFQELHKVRDLVAAQVARFSVTVVAIVLDQHFLERPCLAVMQVGGRAIDPHERRRVVLRPHFLARVVFAGSHIVQLEGRGGSRIGVKRA